MVKVQKFTEPIRKLVNAIDRNTRGVAKVISAMNYMGEQRADTFAISGPLEKLLAERRLLRAALEAELKMERSWKEKQVAS